MRFAGIFAGDKLQRVDGVGVDGVQVAQLAPAMTDPWVDNEMIQDYDSPYLITPDIERMRRGSMNQFIDNPEVLKRTFKGV